MLCMTAMKTLGLAMVAATIGLFSSCAGSLADRRDAANQEADKMSKDMGEEAQNGMDSNESAFCLPPVAITGTNLASQAGTCRGGDNGEGLPGYLTDLVSTGQKSQKDSTISFKFPANSLKVESGNIKEVNVIVLQVDESQIMAPHAINDYLTGTVLGLIHPAEDGSISIDRLPLVNDQPIVLRVGGYVSDPRVRVEVMPANSAKAAWAKLKDDAIFALMAP